MSLATPPEIRWPYTRWFYPGTEDPAAAALIQLTDKPGPVRFDLTLPDPQHERPIRGIVLWPDGRRAAKADVCLEDPRYPRPTYVGATNAEGSFSMQVLDGTRYRVHAVANTRNIDRVSSEPAPVEPGPHPLDLVLVLTRHGSPEPPQ